MCWVSNEHVCERAYLNVWVCMPAPACAYCRNVVRQTQRQKQSKGHAQHYVMNWVPWNLISKGSIWSAPQTWTQNWQTMTRRKRKELRRRRKEELAEEEDLNEKSHLLVHRLSRALMAENKEKYHKNRLLHQSCRSLCGKWNNEMTDGQPHPFCFSPIFFFLCLMLTCSLMAWCFPDVRSGAIWLHSLSLWT